MCSAECCIVLHAPPTRLNAISLIERVVTTKHLGCGMGADAGDRRLHRSAYTIHIEMSQLMNRHLPNAARLISPPRTR
jgi:hypothetical protein